MNRSNYASADNSFYIKETKLIEPYSVTVSKKDLIVITNKCCRFLKIPKIDIKFTFQEGGAYFDPNELYINYGLKWGLVGRYALHEVSHYHEYLLLGEKAWLKEYDTNPKYSDGEYGYHHSKLFQKTYNSLLKNLPQLIGPNYKYFPVYSNQYKWV